MLSVRLKHHSTLASYFASKLLYLDEPIQKKPNSRKLVEQPWQELEAAKNVEKQFEKNPEIKEHREILWDNATNNLCNLDFIQAKAAAKMTYELVNDFNAVLLVIPENQVNIKKSQERQVILDKYAKDLSLYAKGSLLKLDLPETFAPKSQDQNNKEVERIKNKPTKSDKIIDFLHFIGNEAMNLQKFSSKFNGFATQQAWNYANDGPVGLSAERNISKISDRLLLNCKYSRPNWNPIPQVIKTLMEETPLVNSVAISIDEKRAITASNNGCTQWDLETGSGKNIFQLSDPGLRIEGVALTSDGKTAFMGGYNTMYSFEEGPHLCLLWDIENKKLLKKLICSYEVKCVAITPDGDFAISGHRNGICIIWNLASGRPIKTLEKHDKSVNSIQITADKNYAFSGSDDCTCILWDLNTGTILRHFTKHTREVNSVSITPDGEKAITGSNDQNCILWDLKTGKALKTIENHNSHIEGVAITPDARFALITSFYNKCILYDLFTGSPITNLAGHKSFVIDVAISPDAKIAYSTSHDGTSIIWDIYHGKFIQPNGVHTQGISHIAVSTDGKFVITAGCVDSMLLFSDLKTNKPIKQLKGHTKLVHGLAITPDSKMAVSCSEDKTCILWNLTTGKAINIFDWENQQFNALALSPDGKRVVFASGNRLGVIWDLEYNVAYKALNGPDAWYDHYTYAASTPDGHCFLTAIGNSYDLILWDATSGKAIRTFETFGLARHRHAYIIVTPDGKSAISFASYGELVCWDLRSGSRNNAYKWPAADLSSMAITPDGKRIIISTDKGTTAIYDIESEETLAIFVANYIINNITVIPNGLCLGTATNFPVSLNLHSDSLNKIHGILTIRQIWDFEFHKHQAPSADCPLCGCRFEPSLSIIHTIIDIVKEAGIKLEQSPCLELSDEAWEHPGLIDECPNCHEKLKFNPFFGSDIEEIIDYYSSKERDIQYHNKFDMAENAYYKGNWDEAYNLYLKLLQQENFELKYWYNMAICGINCLTKDSQEIINNIKIIIQILQDNCVSDKAELITEKFIERLNAIKPEELAMQRAAMPLSNYSQEMKTKYQNMFDEAEIAFNEKKWEEAYTSYLKVVQQGQFDINYMRYNMSICKLNTLFTDNPEIISNINNLIKLLNDKGANDKAQIIADRLKERMNTIKQEEILRKKAATPWWKKMFGN